MPYRGTAPAMRDLVAGQIDLMIDQASNVLPQLRAGTIKAFAVTATERLPSAPDVPTVDEVGLPDLHVSVWHGVWAPQGHAGGVITKVNGAIVTALCDPRRATSSRRSARRFRRPTSARRRRSPPSKRRRSRSGGRS